MLPSEKQIRIVRQTCTEKGYPPPARILSVPSPLVVVVAGAFATAVRYLDRTHSLESVAGNLCWNDSAAKWKINGPPDPAAMWKEAGTRPCDSIEAQEWCDHVGLDVARFGSDIGKIRTTFADRDDLTNFGLDFTKDGLLDRSGQLIRLSRDGVVWSAVHRVNSVIRDMMRDLLARVPMAMGIDQTIAALWGGDMAVGPLIIRHPRSPFEAASPKAVVFPDASRDAIRQATIAAAQPITAAVLTALKPAMDEALDALAGDTGKEKAISCLAMVLLQSLAWCLCLQIGNLGGLLEEVLGRRGSTGFDQPNHADDAGDVWLVSERPETLKVDEDDLPHSTSGPSIRWVDGVSIYTLHGTRVPSWVVEQPEFITVAQILAERDRALRHRIIECYRRGDTLSGLARFVIDAGAEVVDHDERFGTLLRLSLSGEDPILMVRVRNQTARPDGSFEEHFLCVDPQCRPMLPGWKNFGEPQELTAHAAVASTWGMRAVEFNPLVRS